MATTHDTTASDIVCSGSGEGAATGKRRYEPPRILFREPIEQIAAVCDTNFGGKGQFPQCSVASS